MPHEISNMQRGMEYLYKGRNSSFMHTSLDNDLLGSSLPSINNSMTRQERRESMRRNDEEKISDFLGRTLNKTRFTSKEKKRSSPKFAGRIFKRNFKNKDLLETNKYKNTRNKGIINRSIDVQK